MRYVWTKLAEERAKKLGLEPRKAGMTAMYAGEPVTGDYKNPLDTGVAHAWYQRGYIEVVDDAKT